ncbi:MAG: hypothetical protein ABIP80_01875, partial [Ferruginibacter sp.]
MTFKFYLAFAALLLSHSSLAQSLQLHIDIKQGKPDKNIPLTAVLTEVPQGNIVSTIVFKTSASFNIQPQTTYLLKLSAVGIQEFGKMIKIDDSSLTVLIDLQNKTSSLGNVTVVSRKPLIRQEDDKTIVDAEVLAQSSSNAYEILEKVPGAVVDQDGNVYLNSATPAMIQINGRDVKLNSADLASLLKSLPANSVVKIEVLRSPSAKYDASSSGGILNIVLKKGVKIGTNGSVNVGYFQGRYHTLTGGVNLNKSTKKFNSYVSYQATERKNYETLASLRFISRDTSVIDQHSYTTYPTINNYFSAGTDLAVNEKFTIGYDGRLSLNNNKSFSQNDINIFNSFTSLTTNQNKSLINSKSNSLYIGNDVSSKYKIDSIGSEWTTSVDFNYFKNNNNQVYNNGFLLPSKPAISGD